MVKDDEPIRKKEKRPVPKKKSSINDFILNALGDAEKTSIHPIPKIGFATCIASVRRRTPTFIRKRIESLIEQGKIQSKQIDGGDYISLKPFPTVEEPMIEVEIPNEAINRLVSELIARRPSKTYDEIIAQRKPEWLAEYAPDDDIRQALHARPWESTLEAAKNVVRICIAKSKAIEQFQEQASDIVQTAQAGEKELQKALALGDHLARYARARVQEETGAAGCPGDPIHEAIKFFETVAYGEGRESIRKEDD